MATAQLEDPKQKVWTLEEFYRLLDLGFFIGRRVELVEGEIVEMAAQKNLHAVGIKFMEEALIAAFGPGHWVRVQMTFDIVNSSALDPDLAVIRGSARDHIASSNPTSALLIVEVSDTTLRYDQKRKSSIYAKAGVEDYWILNLVDGQLEVRRNPGPDPAEETGFGYARISIHESSDVVSPLAAANAVIRVSDLLP